MYRFPIRGGVWTWREYWELLQGLLVPRAQGARLRKDAEDWIEACYEVRPILVNSGRSALKIALQRIRDTAGSGTPVAVPSLVCRAVPDAIRSAGLKPLFFDIGEDLAASQTEATRMAAAGGAVAVVFPYLYGKVSDCASLAAECKKAGRYLIEDAAASFLVSDATGRLSGSLGDYVIFSFSIGKTVVAGGGGALLDRVSARAAAVKDWPASVQRRLAADKVAFAAQYFWPGLWYRSSRAVGQRGPGYHKQTIEEIRPISVIDLRLLHRQLDGWEARYHRKTAILRRYAERLAGTALALPQYVEGGYVNRLFVRFPRPMLKRPDNAPAESAAVGWLRSQGVQIQLPYFPCHQMADFAEFVNGDMPCTNALADSAIEVPSQITLRDSDVDAICRLLLKCNESVR
jgi:dTDP-4-amino-4,6-dideoxygalactose transaminase